ncbi:MAG: phage capsid protein [Alphaproteobacteria bacterium]|jgi:hypothetical protein|nr:phage capsid protein [Alphaproteobacteria bacterium]MCV6599034.1 phage capsid protein [Alphaproteobacteria bacterium]
MSTSIDQAFVKQFEREVHESFQRMGSKLVNTVRSKNNVLGSSTTFQKIGKGVASTKARNGTVPVMNLAHSTVECALSDYYAGDWVDRLDEVKTNIDERGVIANAGAYALGRKADDLIIAELSKSTNYAGSNSDGMTKAKILEAFEILGAADVPDDGNRFVVLGHKQFTELLSIPEFASAEYVGSDELPFKNAQAKKWLGATFIAHSGLPKSSNVRKCFFYHKNAIGHASGADIKTDISWHGDRASHFVNNMMSQGAKIVDTAGVVVMRCLES